MNGKGFSWSVLAIHIGDIPVYLHLSLVLLFTWVAGQEFFSGGDIMAELGFVALLFLCILLHELGHALCARKFGIRTREIVLYPFGGIAALEDSPRPREELFIALAGPLVNLALCFLIFPATSFSQMQPEDIEQGNFSLILTPLDRLLLANILLALFNLLPAFPMDGGRVLRALLALFGLRKASFYTAIVSKLLCLLLGALAIWSGDIILFAIAAFVFLASTQERLHERAVKTAQGHTVKEVYSERDLLKSFPHGTLISEAAEVIVKTNQNSFPVLHGDELLGVVFHNEVLAASMAVKEELQEDDYISSLLHRDYEEVARECPLTEILPYLQKNAFFPLVVLDESKHFCGLLERDRLLEFLLLQNSGDAPAGRKTSGDNDSEDSQE